MKTSFSSKITPFFSMSSLAASRMEYDHGSLGLGGLVQPGMSVGVEHGGDAAGLEPSQHVEQVIEPSGHEALVAEAVPGW